MRLARSFQRLLELGTRVPGAELGFRALGDNLHGQVLVDDWRHLQSPVPVTLLGFRGIGLPGAADRGVLAYTAPPEGAFIVEAATDVATALFGGIPSPYGIGASAAGCPGFVGGAPMVVTEGFRPSGTVPRGTVAAGVTADPTAIDGPSFSSFLRYGGVFLQGGFTFWLVEPVVATLTSFSMIVRELPAK